MLLLKNPYLDLIHQYIETERCIIVPFSTNGLIDIKEYYREFNKANKDGWLTDVEIDPYDELEITKKNIITMGNNERFDNFILNKETGDLLGGISLNTPEEESVNIVLWICDDEEWKWYGTEVYEAMLTWCRANTAYDFLIHTVHVQNERTGRLILKYKGKLQNWRTSQWYLIFHIPLR